MTTMRALVARAVGGPAAVACLETRAVREPGNGQARIRVHAAPIDPNGPHLRHGFAVRRGANARVDEGGSVEQLEELKFRVAGPEDAAAVARLHTDSWRRHYRGAFSDAFLDGDVFADRVAVWTDRLREPDPRRCTILAEDSSLIGFVSTFFDDDPPWGALLDNLHVADG